MADGRLRELERAAAAGDVGAGSQLLAERVRAGTLTTEQVDLAAFLNDPAARALRPDAPRVEFPPLWDASLPQRRDTSTPRGWSKRVSRQYARAWAEQLGAWDREPLVRAGLAAAALVAPALDRRRTDDDPTRAALRAAERWLTVGEDAEQDCVRAGDAAAHTARTFLIDELAARDADHCAATTASLVAYTAGANTHPAAVDGARDALRTASQAWFAMHPAPEIDAHDWSCPTDPLDFCNAVHAAVHAALLCWVLA